MNATRHTIRPGQWYNHNGRLRYKPLFKTISPIEKTDTLRCLYGGYEIHDAFQAVKSQIWPGNPQRWRAAPLECIEFTGDVIMAQTQSLLLEAIDIHYMPRRKYKRQFAPGTPAAAQAVIGEFAKAAPSMDPPATCPRSRRQKQRP